ncbi:transmembrane protein 199 [Zootermopsis nevadensis]|uniref:transmembrane protein 199 n=1 Tax=Zootermopsis nevadensis TaxID=136037 RepID=UPI000B8EB768|nr:transmembrane protein 199 [Zootermopsis nevadensis]
MGCDVKLPRPEVEPRNQELEARIQCLKARQANREYKAMTRNVDTFRVHEPEETISYHLKQMNKQLIAVLQFIISVLAGFAFGFIGIELIVGNLDFGFRLLLGVIFALIIALAEIYFLAKKLSEDIPSTLTPPEQRAFPTAKPHQE